MRKLYFLLFILFSFFATALTSFSQTVTIGTGTDVQRQPLTYYYGYGRSAMIYTAAEMGTISNGASVLSIAFYCELALNTGPTVIYLREVSSTTMQASATWDSKIALATEVYSGTPALGADNSWRTITLSTPFPLAANQNLEVLVETNFGGTGNGDGDGNKIRYSTTGSDDTHQFWQQDNAPPVIAGTVNNQRPNIQFVLGPPIVCVSPPGGGTIEGPLAPVCIGSTFTLSVTGGSFGSGLTYQWESSADGTTWTPITDAILQTLKTSVGANTYFHRKITCSGQDAYSSSLLVTVKPAVTSFPWTENFDAPAIPGCWYNEYVTDAVDWTFVSTNGNGSITPRTGAGMAEFRYNDYGQATKLVTPKLDISSLASPRLRFWFANVNWFGDIDELRVYYKSSYGGPWIQIGIDYTAEHTEWTEVVLSLPNPSNDYYIAFEATSNFARGLDLDDITVEATPPCEVPPGISVTGQTPSTAVLNWQAAVTPANGGYEWEVRTSGNAGSGSTGLAANGATAAGVLTANATGLISNTAYSLYVRSVCAAGTLYSDWSNGYSFRTTCNTITSLPYTETFETSSPTRSCWWSTQVSGTVAWTFGAGAGNDLGSVTTAHGGTENARYFGNGTGSVARLVSPAFDFSSLNPALGAQLTFWYANENFLGDQNELRVYYKTSAAGAWTLIPGAEFTSNTSAWKEVELQLPSSTSSEYYIAFEGAELFGFGIGIDDVTISAAPSCPKPKNFTVISTTPTTAIATFDAPGNSFIIEYGAPGFTPGTGAGAGGGTIITGAASPINISNLTAGTLYDFYLRRECDPGVDYSENVKFTVSSLCDPIDVPYVQDFETATPPLGFPSCTSTEDVNGNSGPEPNLGGGSWTTFDGDADTYHSPTHAMRYLYDAADLSRGADDWFYLQGLNLTGGTSYRLKFFYKGSDGPNWIEGLEVKYGTIAHSSAMTNTIYTNDNIATALADPWDSARVDFTPATTGVYYIGFHATSLPDQAFLYIDDISVKAAPTIDVGITGISGMSACPASAAVLNATIRNYNITGIDFAANPVTITANITGAATTTLTVTLNSGSLDPGATMSVPLPAFNYETGLYNVTASTSSPDDPETGNDANSTSFFVNPSPAVAVVTPAAPQICFGQTVQLSTQFTTPPAEPDTMSNSSTVAVAIPDNSSTGVTSTLTIDNVPAGATILGISVTLNVSHTFVSDLAINLRAPNGQVLNLFNNKGDFFEADLVNTEISSFATASIPVTGAPFTGTYLPDAAAGIGADGNVSNASKFSDLFGAANGDWTLSLRDYFAQDVGTLTSWSIKIVYGFPAPKITWSPLTGLFTDADATLAYVGENAASVYAKPDANTTYTVTSVDPRTNCSTTRTVDITVNSNPIVTIDALPTKICLSDTAVSLSASPTGGIWSGRGVSGAIFSPTRAAIGSQPISYTYTDADGCTTVETTNARVEDCPERRILLRDSAVMVYPNPNDGRFSIRVRSTLYNKLTMRVYTSTGILVRTQQFSGLVYNRRIDIDLTNLPGGSYMVHLFYDAGVHTSEKTYQVIIGR